MKEFMKILKGREAKEKKPPVEQPVAEKTKVITKTAPKKAPVKVVVAGDDKK